MQKSRRQQFKKTAQMSEVRKAVDVTLQRLGKVKSKNDLQVTIP